MNVPLWDNIFNFFFKDHSNLKFLELGTGNGLCANYLLENFDCHVDTVDLNESAVVEEGGEKFLVSIINNLKPFISSKRCTFHQMSTKEFLYNNSENEYDFIYIDACHDPEGSLFDGVNAFHLLKTGGLMIFDDYTWGNCGLGIDAFLYAYAAHDRRTKVPPSIEVLHKGGQVAIKKITNSRDL